MYQKFSYSLAGLLVLVAMLSATSAHSQNGSFLDGLTSSFSSDSEQLAHGGLVGREGEETVYVGIPWVRYATGLLRSPRGAAVGHDEKLFAIALQVENRGSEPDFVGAGRFEILISDEHGRSFKETVFVGTGVGGTQDIVTLEPGERGNALVVLVIPASSEITRIRIRDSQVGRHGTELAIVPGGRVPLIQLPSSISDTGYTLAAIIDGHAGLWYALGQTDVRLIQYSMHTAPVFGQRASEQAPVLAATIEVRNRGNSPLRINRSLFRGTAVSATTGERSTVWRIVGPTGNASIEPTLPGGTSKYTLLFQVPPGVAPGDIMLAESVNSRGGISSHKYKMLLANAPGENSFHGEGVLAPGHISANIVRDQPVAPSFPNVLGTIRSEPYVRLESDDLPGLGMQESVEASYLLGLRSVNPRHAVTAEEKITTVRLNLKNLSAKAALDTGGPDKEISTNRLKISFEDMFGARHDVAQMRIAHSIETVDAILETGNKLTIEATAVVPANVRINKVHIRQSHSDTAKQISLSEVEPLPDSVSTDGSSVAASLSGKHGTWYPLGTVDVRMNSWSSVEGGVMGAIPNDHYDYGIVAISVRNRANQEIRLHNGLFQGTNLVVNDTPDHTFNLLFNTNDREVDFPMLSGQEINVRMVYRMPKNATASEFRILEKIGSRGGAESRRIEFDVNGSAPGLLAAATVGVDYPVDPGVAPSWELAEIPTIGDSSAPTSVVSLPTEVMPVAAGIPEGAIQDEEFAISTAAGPMVLDTIPTGQIDLDISAADYIVRMKDFTISTQESENKSEYQLMIFKYRGRFGETIVTPNHYARREHLNEADSGRPGKTISLVSRVDLRSEFIEVQPLEVMALVFILIERDRTPGHKRQEFMRSTHSNFSRTFYNEFSRNLDVDYGNLTGADRDKVIEAFHRSAAVFTDEVEAMPRRWLSDAANDDDVSQAEPFLWINTDDASNPGIIAGIDDRQRRTTYPHPWPEFIGVSLETDPGEHQRLRIEINRE